MSKWILVLMMALMLPLTGCSKKTDTAKPVEQVRTEVQSMSIQDLEANAKAYADAILAKQGEVEKVAQEMKEIPVTQMLSDKAKGLKDQLVGMQTEVAGLAERYQIYAEKYQQLGGDMTKIKVG